MKLRIHNESMRPLTLVIEPYADSYELEPGAEATADGEFEREQDGSICITLHESDQGRFAVLYQDGDNDVAVTNHGRKPDPFDGLKFEMP